MSEKPRVPGGPKAARPGLEPRLVAGTAAAERAVTTAAGERKGMGSGATHGVRLAYPSITGICPYRVCTNM